MTTPAEPETDTEPESPEPAHAPATPRATLTPDQFADLLPILRPHLLQSARTRYSSASDQDAEDLVQDTIVRALGMLQKFHSDHATRSAALADDLLCWLERTMYQPYDAQRKRNRRRPLTVSIVEARDEPAPPDPSPDSRISINQRPLNHYLPQHYEQLVTAWLEGWSQEEIAQGFNLHRNTVGVRLEYAFQILNRKFPRKDEVTFSQGMINMCSRVPVYHKPGGMTTRWMRKHPADRNFLSRPRRRLGIGHTTLRVLKPAKPD